jgi:hypothetical protein
MRCRLPLALAAVLAALTAPTLAGNEPASTRLVPIGEGWARSSVNASIFRQHSVVSHRDTQVAAFYDGEARMVLARRRLGETRWETHRTQYTGNVEDAHNAISIGIDGRGILHVSWDHHGQPLNYARGVAPGALQLGERLSMTGRRESNVTYPQFFHLANGDLVFVYRDGGSGKGDVLLNRYDRTSATWRALQHPLIDGEGARNAYVNQVAIDARGGWHISWCWRETPDVATNHDIQYAYSPDEGRTWQTTSGQPYVLPITLATGETVAAVPTGRDLINQTSMTIDGRGRPVIASYWRPVDSAVPQYHVAWHDGRAWQVRQVGARDQAFTLGGRGTRRIPISRPQVVAGRGHTLHVIFRDRARGGGVSVATTTDPDRRRWDVREIDARPVGQWEPTYDPVAWSQAGTLHLLHQVVGQGDGETLEDVPPQVVSILEWVP